MPGQFRIWLKLVDAEWIAPDLVTSAVTSMIRSPRWRQAIIIEDILFVTNDRRMEVLGPEYALAGVACCEPDAAATANS
jgi:hypothetical protein